ncbi:MAG: hypothetical protein B7Z66_13695 [Chromatiales bacterium 21-64-14]|nr:MAG: hypothetical protein B7Z66_13695 [Chromatiales bacterium 21-64-14]HQU15294.1 2OG-Fe(II) oxygenase [Gammaproteobacteria bacterium]
MSVLDLDAFRATPLARDPFEFVIVPGFVRSAALARVVEDFPRIRRPGSFPLRDLRYGPAFQGFVDALDGAEFAAAVEEKFGLDLAGRPTLFTVRGWCRKRDGRIHTDTESKLITVLIYMNPSWEESGGRLRLLRSARLDDVAAEVPPVAGTLLAFRRSERSFHGHEPFAGPRRAIQMNWVSDQRVVDQELARHGFSSFLKRLSPFH